MANTYTKIYLHIVFSVKNRHSHIKDVAAYISGQAGHHKRYTYRDELTERYKAYGIDYDERYAFDV